MSDSKKNMAANHKRHGKKSEKETQSQVVNVFKEIIQRENNDPEKANLLREPLENKKRRQYFSSRSKVDHHSHQRAVDSSSSDRNKRNYKEKMNAYHDKMDTQYGAYQPQSMTSDKKDCWRFWGSQKKTSEDTSSRVSCALKKVISSEYTCIACLSVCFLVSVLAAFYLVFRTPGLPEKSEKTYPQKCPYKMNSDSVKRQIDILQKGRSYDDQVAQRDRLNGIKSWDDTASRHLNGLAELTGYDDNNYRFLNSLDSSLKTDDSLSSILGTDKVNDGLSSGKLRDFYKKLIQTDAQIRNLKKSIGDNSDNSVPTDGLNFLPDRRKRSLKLSYPKTHLRQKAKKDSDLKVSDANAYEVSKFHLYFPPLAALKNAPTEKVKVKRYANGSEMPSAFMIEKKQILLEFKPHDGIRKVPKCSHAPKDSKYHEKQLKHPFYKNTQRLDELLDQFIDKNLPELLADPFGVDTLIKKTNDKIKQRVHDNNMPLKNKIPYVIETTTFNYGKGVTDKIIKYDKGMQGLIELMKTNKDGKVSISTSDYLMYTPTTMKVNMLNSDLGLPRLDLSNDISVNRKLLQAHDEVDESLGYEDVNEVLADEMETHDDLDQAHDRQKRFNDYIENTIQDTNQKYVLQPSGSNPNWKGPMPLYPDELVSMIKQAAMQNMPNESKETVPINIQNMPSDVENSDKELNDMDYIENYSLNKNDQLQKMAQAYSDYGVLDDKKETIKTEKGQAIDEKPSDRRIKLLLPKDNTKKPSTVVRKLRKGCKENKTISIMDVLKNHFKFGCPDKQSFVDLPQNSFAQNTESVTDFNSKVENDERIRNGYDKTKFSKRRSRSLLQENSESYDNYRIEDDEDDDYDDGEEDSSDVRIKRNTNIMFNDTAIGSKFDNYSIKQDLNSESNEEKEMDLSGFLAMVSDWFRSLAASAVNNSNATTAKNKTYIKKLNMDNTSDNILHGTGVVESLSHKSRALMSINDNKNSFTYEATEGKDKLVLGTESNQDPLRPNFTAVNKQRVDLEDNNAGYNGVANKTVVKRNANQGSNLIFWRDMYDDEYGIRTDPLETVVRDKKQYTKKGLDFVKKSKNWVEDKFKSIARNIRKKPKCKVIITTKKPAGLVKQVPATKKPFNKYYKRNAVQEEEATNHLSNFEELTTKMKEICKEAAQAVQETRNIKVRQNSKEDSMSTSLMQQLVQLMSSLVDFQVQQKTCVRLPPDLQDFLQWLTASEDTADSAQKDFQLQDLEQPKDIFSREKEDLPIDSKSDCLGTLRSVEDLMQQFDVMTDEEKSKMTGVREYLENQMLFLNRQISTHNDMANTYLEKDRYRRDAIQNGKQIHRKQFRQNTKKNRQHRLKRKFFKNSKKHTRTTISIYDGFINTETLKGNFNTVNDKGHVNEELRNKDEKRNLNDVYYKAVADSKKYTTIHKKDELDGFDNAQVVRVEK